MLLAALNRVLASSRAVFHSANSLEENYGYFSEKKRLHIARYIPGVTLSPRAERELRRAKKRFGNHFLSAESWQAAPVRQIFFGWEVCDVEGPVKLILCYVRPS
ncbi:MAG: hypothetical protein JWN42_2301 [Candidatus Angelobacter sp.]|nr:hypothetical protein [Candidatus Angelobacter sp.]